MLKKKEGVVIPYHSVDRGVERLTLFPEYRENKAVEAEPNDTHHEGPTQPAVAVDVFLSIIGVQILGALTDHTVPNQIKPKNVSLPEN